jgi:hypothetical protein
MLNLAMLQLHRKLFPSSKGTNWITARSVLTFLLPATIAVGEEVSVVVAVDAGVDVAAALVVVVEVVDSVETVVAEVGAVVDVVVLEAAEVVGARPSRERRLHSKLAYLVPFEGLWAVVGLWV